MNERSRGLVPRVRARRDAILKVLVDGTHPMTMREVTKALGTGASQGQVYADLRQLCGSARLAYGDWPKDGRVNYPGYPVIWNSWHSSGAMVTFELTTEARIDLTSNESDDLEAMFDAPAYTPTGGDQ